MLKETVGKYIDTKSIQYVYQWVDPTMKPFKEYGDFLLSETKREFEYIYGQER